MISAERSSGKAGTGTTYDSPVEEHDQLVNRFLQLVNRFVTIHVSGTHSLNLDEQESQLTAVRTSLP